MIVIADTSPLNYLILVGEADVLPKLFGRVLVPAGVVKELERDLAPAEVRKWISKPPSWLEVRSVKKPKASELDNLGTGEREAIWLAEEIYPDWLIIDDFAGRQAASRRHLPVMGTLRVLDQAAAQNLIDLPKVVAKFERTTFFLSADLIQWLLNRDAKRKKS